MSGGGQALAASRRENADLGKELETTVQKAEKWRCDAEMRQGAFHRALALKKRHEVPPLCRSAETTENERLKSRSRRFARELFGRRRGTPSHGRTQRPELPVREKEAIPDRRTYPDCGKVWVSNGWKDTEIVEVAAHARRIRRKRLRPACACRPEKEAVGPAPARRSVKSKRKMHGRIDTRSCLVFELDKTSDGYVELPGRRQAFLTHTS